MTCLVEARRHNAFQAGRQRGVDGGCCGFRRIIGWHGLGPPYADWALLGAALLEVGGSGQRWSTVPANGATPVVVFSVAVVVVCLIELSQAPCGLRPAGRLRGEVLARLYGCRLGSAGHQCNHNAVKEIFVVETIQVSGCWSSSRGCVQENAQEPSDRDR